MVSSINGHDFVCLSSDTKPTTDSAAEELGYGYLANGSTMLEMDTGKVYVFDTANDVWREL